MALLKLGFFCVCCLIVAALLVWQAVREDDDKEM